MAAAYRTLETLRRELSARLGFAAQHTNINTGLLDSLLREANNQLWAQVNWKHKRKSLETTLTVASGGRFLDYPADCEPGFITDIYAKVSGQWIELEEGIDAERRLLASPASFPLRFAESYESGTAVKLEFWPVVSQNTDIRIEYTASPSEFTQPGDRPSVPDQLVLLHALVNAKLHYRQPDAQVYSSQLEALLAKHKKANFGKATFSPRAKEKEFDPYLLPPR